MKFPLSWLAELVDINVTTQELATTLSMAGLEVESVETIGDNITGITTAKIQSINPHPNADRLVVTQVHDGTTTYQIVTGAKNITVGDVVPVSLVGATLASGLKIKASNLRGVDSNGMLCSKEECGLEPDIDGIWILDQNTPLGVNFVDYACLNDTILDVAILPNRGDCQSVLGLAREIATLTNQPFKLPNIDYKKSAIEHAYTVTSQDKHCPYYVGRYICNCHNGQSPLWLTRRLQLCGIRPISLLVDITNYVLLETGQPLHAFDDNLCKSRQITIKCPLKPVDFITLDSIKRNAKPTNLLIYEGSTPVAIAGVMGGVSTEVSDQTTAIFLEAAYFDPTSVRKTATQLGLRTDSAIRFEKGVDVSMVDYASDRACQLFTQLAQATVSDQVSIFKDESHACFKQTQLDFDLDQINSFLGTSYSIHQATTCLESLGFKLHDNKLTVPSWRQHDIENWPCVAEELLRCLGFDSVPSKLNHNIILNDQDDGLVKLMSTTQDFFVSNGFYEINTYPMISAKDLISLNQPLTPEIELANPISKELAVMRPSLLPSFLRLINYHQDRQINSGSYFEIGRGFTTDTETTYLSAGIASSYLTQTYNKQQQHLSAEIYDHLKHTLHRWFKLNNIAVEFKSVKTPPAFAHPQIYQEVVVGNVTLGYITQCHPNYLDQFDIELPVVFTEISLDSVLNLLNQSLTYQPFSRFPSTRRDIALLVPNNLTYAEILTFITKYKHKMVTDVGVFDVFKSEQLGSDKQSIGIYFIYQDIKGTLSDKKVNNAHDHLCQRLIKELNVEIR